MAVKAASRGGITLNLGTEPEVHMILQRVAFIMLFR